MTDRRSETSRANLGDHIPEALDPAGSVVVAVRLARAVLTEADKFASDTGRTRSEALRYLIAYALNRT